VNWEHRNELRADPGIAPGDRNVGVVKRRSIWPSIAVVAAAAAFGGVIWFAYRNAHNTQSGAPPLIKAETGPIKIKPADPGGKEIPFQDSTVYDRLGQKGPGTQKPTMEKILPPPETPVERPTQPSPASPAPATIPSSLEPPPTSAPPLANQISAPPAPDTGSPTVLAPPPGSMILAPPPVLAPPKSVAPAKAPTPPIVAQPVKPLVAPAPQTKAAQVPAPQAKTAATKPLPAGSYRIQLGSVRSQDAAAVEWARLKHRYPEILGSLNLVSSKTDVPGKGVFYRVQAGPVDAIGATSTCRELSDQHVGCIVIKP
jgi:cell division septation protein DedD